MQESIPYLAMYKDGVCHVKDKLYTKTLTFNDVSYHLAQNEEQQQIFQGYGNFLNYFDSSISVQLSFINKQAFIKDLRESVYIPRQTGELEQIRLEFSKMIISRFDKGSNGFVKSKYITVGVEADSLRAAKLRLGRIETDIRNNLRSLLGVTAQTLSGYERLEVLHGQFHPNGSKKLVFSWDDIIKTGLTTKDFIAPDSFDFGGSRSFRMGDMIGAVSHLQIITPELSDKMLSDILAMNESLTVTLHIQSIDQIEAIKTIKRKLSDLDAMKIQEQRKAVQSGYDMEVLPSDLVTYGKEAQTLLNDLQSRNERMFLVTILFMNTAKKKQKLDDCYFAASGIAQKYNCMFRSLEFQQEQGLMSSLILGINQIEIQRGLTTSSTAAFIPFTATELFQHGEAMYYGLNAVSNNLIMANRKSLKNPNGLYLGNSGSGKSFAAKREILNVFLITQDDIFIADPEAEYFPIVQRLGGQIIRLSPATTQYINPMDINPNYSDDDPISLKSDFILSFCEEAVKRKSGLLPVEKTVIDRCVRRIYTDYLANPIPERMPLLEDLFRMLQKQPELEAQNVATALELYVTGSHSLFNHRTNVDIHNRLVCFETKELGNSLKKLGMLILQDAVWNRVSMNRSRRKTTWFYMDELHLLLRDEQTAAYTVEIWKRFRKWGGIPSGLTQNIGDLLASQEVENIFENSDFIYLFSQGPGDRQILAKQLGISPHQLSYLAHSSIGEGLLCFGGTIIPFTDRMNPGDLYSLMSTRPSEIMIEDKARGV